jgi:crotonobetainyl-CoA:carnitine CoA-transferase CaiB-like acyl-CoA transferase
MIMSGSENVQGKKGILSGIRIVDMGSIVMGPYATQILADMGADVIKIENAGGDLMRYAGKSPTPLMGGVYMQCNRNKKSVELNLADELSREAVNKLIATADVFFTNVRLGGLKRLGYDYEGVKSIKSDIIYVHGVGYGQDGAYGGRPAYDDLVQAASGVSSLLQESGTCKEPRYFPSIVADKTTALHAAYAMLAALFHRERTGEGQFVEVGMLESFVSFMMVETLYGHSYDPPQGPMAYSRCVNPNRKPFPTKDGFIGMVPYKDEQWVGLFDMAERPDLKADPRFATFQSRTEHITELYGAVAEATKSKTTAEWVKLLHEAQIPYMPVQSMYDVLEDEHLKSINFFEKREHPTEGTWINVKHPVTFEKTPATDVYIDPPKIGQHNEEVLSELGFSEEQIKAIADKAAPQEITMYG